MKPIQLLSYYYLPENTAAVNRVTSFVSSLEKVTDVSVITLDKSGEYPGTNSNVTRLAYRNYDDASSVHRLVGELINSYKIIKASNKKPDCIVMLTVPSIFLLLLSPLLKRTRLVVDLRDLVWKYLINLGGFSALVGRLFGFIAKYAIARADLVLVTNNSELDEVRRINANTILLPNGISADKFELLTTIAAKTQSRSSETLNLLYAGNIGQAQNIDELVPIIASADNVQLKIIGNGTAEKSLEQQLAASNVGHIKHINKLPWSELGEHFQQADVLIIKLSPEYSTAIPSKLYEYLALDKPVLIIADGYLHAFAQQFSNTYLLKCDELQSLPAVLDEIRRVDNNGIRSSEVIRENYIRDTLNERLIGAINRWE